jgi:hypothetical protein
VSRRGWVMQGGFLGGEPPGIVMDNNICIAIGQDRLLKDACISDQHSPHAPLSVANQKGKPAAMISEFYVSMERALTSLTSSLA